MGGGGGSFLGAIRREPKWIKHTEDSFKPLYDRRGDYFKVTHKPAGLQKVSHMSVTNLITTVAV